jgi:hypothetical protein
MKHTQIRKGAAPTPEADRYPLTFGTLELTGKDGQTVSRITYNPGEPPHRPYPLKAKHRKGRK